MSEIADIDLEQLKFVDEVKVSFAANNLKLRDAVYWPERGELFFKGPVPRNWMLEAYRLPGKAMVVAMEIWYYARLTKSPTVRLNLSRIQGVSRDTARRGLLALEKTKLISVERHLGRCPVVKILIKKQKKNSNLSNGNGKESGMRGEELS